MWGGIRTVIGSRHIRRRASAKKKRGQQYERGGENKTLIGALLQIDFLVKRFSHKLLMSEFQNCTNVYNRRCWSVALVNCAIALSIYPTRHSWYFVTCTQGWVLMNFEENIQNNNWEIWNHHHHEMTVEIVEGSHTPVIGSNFASHNASCFEDSKY